MNKKQKITISLLSASILAASGLIVFATNGGVLAKAQYSNPAAGTWVHYAAKAPTETEYGIKEYWVGCSEHTHVFSEDDVPDGALIVEAESYDTTGFAENDDRWNKELKPYKFVRSDSSTWCGAKMMRNGDDNVTWAMNGRLNDCKFYGEVALGYKAYGGDKFEWYLPKINFNVYDHVYTHIQTNVWTTDFVVGFSEAYLSDANAVKQSSESQGGLLEFTVVDNKVNAKIKLNGHAEEITAVITDQNIIDGKESIVLWAQATGTGDIYYSMANFVCEASALNFVNYGSVTQVGRYGNAIQPLVSTGGNWGSLTSVANGNYYPASLAVVAMIRGGVETDSEVLNSSDLFYYDGTQITINEWWLRRLFNLHSTFWDDEDIIVLEGDVLNSAGFKINFRRSCFQLAVEDDTLTSVEIVNA